MLGAPLKVCTADKDTVEVMSVRVWENLMDLSAKIGLFGVSFGRQRKVFGTDSMWLVVFKFLSRQEHSFIHSS